jgi:hypothetical protein
MKTASCGWAGHIARVRPSIHAPVPIALANREAFKVFTETAPAEHVLPSIQDTLSEVSVFRGKCPSVGEKVRREKALDFSGCNSRPGTGSLHPVAIETAVEATKLSELSMERVARRLRERTGHNESER